MSMESFSEFRICEMADWTTGSSLRCRRVAGRAEAPERLLECEACFHRIFADNLAVMLLVAPADGRIVDANPAACDFYGHGLETLRSMNISDIDILAPEQVEAEMHLTNESTKKQFVHRLASGEIRDVEVFSGIIDINQQHLLFTIVHDVTERNKLEERLRLNAAALAITRDAVVITDLEARILATNPAFTEITGYTEAEVVGENPRILNSGRQDRAFFEAMWASLLQTGHWQGEIWNRRKSGESYPEFLTIRTVCKEGAPTHYVAVLTDLTQLRQSEDRLRRTVHYDPLTNLPNRLLLSARLQHSLERATRSGHRVGVLVIDLNDFKVVNESLGYAAGDALLVAVAERLNDRLRGVDTLSRFGSDEFVAVLEQYHDIEAVARELLACLEEPFVSPGGHEIIIRASIGIAVFPEDGATTENLLLNANTAMNRAQQQWGNHLAFYTEEMNTQAVLQLVLEAGLRRALEQKEFFLHYQPKVDLRTGRITGAEALLRWHRPGYGVIPPMDFISLAEKSGLIVEIGNWVIEDACRQLRVWRNSGMPNVSVAVNVSARQFCNVELMTTITGALERYGVEPGLLMLELTENMVVADPEKALLRMTDLKRLGVRLSLDDFGTGYSSLSYLSRFPIDQLKIDRSFVEKIVTDPGSATITNSIIALAHRLRLHVVAEGVETESQLEYLRQNGCDEIQGFFFSRPIPAEDFAVLLCQGKALSIRDESPFERTLLVVDDEPEILSALRRSLHDEGFHLLTASSASEGLELLAKNPVQVILTDQRMPEMCGTEFLGRVKMLYPDTVRIVLSGYAELETVLQAVNTGALYKFIPKPWDDEHLREQIRDAFIFYEAVIRPRKDFEKMKASNPPHLKPGTAPCAGSQALDDGELLIPDAKELNVSTCCGVPESLNWVLKEER